MIKKLHFLQLLLVLCLSSFGFCQTKDKSLHLSNSPYTPKIIHYTRNDFNADPKFLTMCENEDGTLIFGNNDGALIFDGEHWQKISLPNSSPINTLFKTNDGRIYAGGYNEMGTLQKNKFGIYFYKSLTPEYHLEEINFENFWQIREFKKHIIYRSFSDLIVVTGNRVTTIPSNKSFIHSEKIGEFYFVQDTGVGIYTFDSKTMSLSLVFDAKYFLNEDIDCFLPTPDPNIIILITQSGIVYEGVINSKTIRKKINLFEGIKKDLVNCGIVDNNFNYTIGTRGSKIINISHSGKITRDSQLYQELSNAMIQNLFQTKNENIWVLQSNELSLLDYKSPFTHAFDKASVYDILVKNKTIYLATNNGVFYSNFINNPKNTTFNFKKIENTQGQAWAIQEFENDIIISHDTGLYKLENGIAKKIDSQNGFWKLTKIKNKKDLYLGSSYYGLYLIEKKGNNWSIKNEIENFRESTRDIIADNKSDTYWVCHGFKGVYKIHINPDYSRVDAVEHFTNKNGFKSPFNINVFNWNNKIVFTTNTGIYTYNNSTNKFEPFNSLNRILDPSKNTRKLIQSKNKTWFIQDDEAGYFIDNKPTLYKDLFLNLKGSFNRGMESIYPIDNNTVLLGTNNGLYLYSLTENKKIFPTIITKITYTKSQKTHYVETNSKENNIQLPNQTNIVRFEFASPKIISSAKIYYSYKLENLDQTWSPWQKMAYKEYTHLRPGNYTFLVKSRNLIGQSGKETSLNFTVLPKWYQTNLAYYLFMATIIFFIYKSIKYVNKRIEFERMKAKLEIEKSKQLLTLELDKLKLKQYQEKIITDKLVLEKDIIDKSKELANYTLLLSKKKDLFDELKMDLKKLRELLITEEPRKIITEIFHKLNQHRIGEDYMEIFDVNFEKINQNFYEKLKSIDSTLTKNELRLCSFVKMNLSNKEIAPLLNISTRGVENARYKIRKKLNIQQEANFTSFLNDLSKNDEI